jgi:serine/threonine protein kinase
MELTVQNVYGLLLRSKLLSMEEARAMYVRWQQEAGDGAGNLARFASWMVAQKYLTEYQASLLARGHAEGFFLNEYKILDRLGKGRMAGVFKARHRLGQVVAIKVLPPSKAKEPLLLARFQREAKLSLLLKHPNIVRAFQVGQAGQLNFLVMEYLEGETLEEVLGRRKLFAPPEAVRLIYQALQGLQHIHGHGLVHRDLKPANLMLVPPPAQAQPPDSTLGCTVKILDIGLGRVGYEEGAEQRDDPGLTGEGVLLGTPDYMAPEQARDPRAIDIRADVYSLGCVLYHLLAGQTPFPDTNIISQMIRHATEAPRRLKEFNPAVPDGLEQIVGWMTAKDPAGRYPTPERAAGALETFLVAGSVPPSSPDLDPEMKPYLTWLETEDSRSPAPRSGPVPTLPATPPLVSIPAKPPSGAALPAAPARPQTPEARIDRHKRKRKVRKERPVPPGLPAGAAAPDPGAVNVELVEVAPAARKHGPGLRLSRRDFVMFVTGVGSVLLAILAGWALAALFGPKKERDQEE